jgi:hypothetical protein
VPQVVRQVSFYRQALVEKEPWKAGKNSGYAESLGLMAQYVAELPDDNPTLRALAGCEHLWCESLGMFELPRDDDGGSSWSDMEAIRCGPRGQAIDLGECAEWLASWARDVMTEAQQLAEKEAEDEAAEAEAEAEAMRSPRPKRPRKPKGS